MVQNISDTEAGDVVLVEPSDRSKRGATSRRYLLWAGGIVYYNISSSYSCEGDAVCAHMCNCVCVAVCVHMHESVSKCEFSCVNSLGSTIQYDGLKVASN